MAGDVHIFGLHRPVVRFESDSTDDVAVNSFNEMIGEKGKQSAAVPLCAKRHWIRWKKRYVTKARNSIRHWQEKEECKKWLSEWRYTREAKEQRRVMDR